MHADQQVERPPAHAWEVNALGKRCGRCAGPIGDSRTAVLSLVGAWAFVPVCRACMRIILSTMDEIEP